MTILVETLLAIMLVMWIVEHVVGWFAFLSGP